MCARSDCRDSAVNRVIVVQCSERQEECHEGDGVLRAGARRGALRPRRHPGQGSRSAGHGPLQEGVWKGESGPLRCRTVLELQRHGAWALLVSGRRFRNT